MAELPEPLDWVKVSVPRMADSALRHRVRTWGKINERQGRQITARSLPVTNEVVFEAWTAGDPAIEGLQVRTISDLDQGSSTLSDLLLRSQGLRTSIWRPASVSEALSNPAIFRAVSLITNTVGSLGIDAYRNGVELADEERPRLLVRPDPFRLPRDFYRDSAYYLATRGECWWWIAKRDIDGAPLSVILMPPWEVTVEHPRNRDRLRPIVKWLDQELPRDDVRLITYLPDDRSPSGPFQRGVGPLQHCGAAISVAVESTEWAANYYAGGGRPPMIIKAAGELGQGDDPDAPSEAETFRDQWMSGDNNTPRVTDQGVDEFIFPPESTQSAQMNDARNNENGNAARMFGIPGALLEYSASGSSLHYQNDLTIFIQFERTCLRPLYLEPIEQQISDLLSRSVVARFNTNAFLKADPLTRATVYEKLVPIGVLSVEEARQDEGLAPGDVEFAPVPFAPPQAVPDQLPIQRAASQEDLVHDWRCGQCHGKLAEVAGPGSVQTCRKCKTVNSLPLVQVRNEPESRIEDLIANLPAQIVAAMPRQSEQPSVQFHDGAFRYEAPDVTVPAPVVNLPPAEVNVAPAQVTVDLAPLYDVIDALRVEVHKSNLPKQRDVIRDPIDKRVMGLTEWTVIDQEKSA